MAPVRDTLRPPPVPAIAPAAAADPARPAPGALLTVAALAGLLYVGRDIFMPLAVAVLLTFTLAPVVNWLRKWSTPRVPAVLLAVGAAFAIIGLVGFIIAGQVAGLARNLPAYQANIVQKVQSLKEMGAGDGVIDRVADSVRRIGAEIEGRRPAGAPAPQAGAPPSGDAATLRTPPALTPPAAPDAPAEAERARQPVPVEIIARESPIETLKNLIAPLVSPFAAAGLVIVLVIFMLLERENLRDRFIRLAGAGDLHRATAALQEAGERVGHYLLMQLLVNVLYAVPVGVGLWLLGIPNAMLWGLLTLALRFVPYIGPAIGMMGPLFLAVAAAPGWSLLLWTAGLFLVAELVSNNVIEPWLYGSRTGLSPIAIIIAAIVWTSLWGPVGLVLSTPVTVCMMVLGRHVRQFAFLDVLLGNEPVLEPHERLYQRLLAGDPHEAADNAGAFLEERYLVDYYGEIGLPALRMGEADRQRGVMDAAQLARFAATAQILVASLTDIALEEEAEDPAGAAPQAGPHSDGVVAKLVEAGRRMVGDGSGDGDGDAAAGPPAPLVLPDGEGRRALVAGGRGELDDVAAAMLAQTLEVQGAHTAVASFTDLGGYGPVDLPLADFDVVTLVYLNVASAAHARQTARRLKRTRPGLRVGVFTPLAEDDPPPPFSAAAVYADFLATRLQDAVTMALAPEPATEPPADQRPWGRRALRPLRAPRPAQPAASPPETAGTSGAGG
ncbi:AI-2E family transporter [Camelimonas abortus]|uniref:AI-2E family transporter n=1 Tax=Camelimonas abortus TaxID=1017184 RepID=A0ABV7LGF4_9HYPH